MDQNLINSLNENAHQLLETSGPVQVFLSGYNPPKGLRLVDWELGLSTSEVSSFLWAP